MDDLYELAGRVGEHLRSRHWQLVTAESCTGGWVSQVVTAVEGSSEWFDRGFVTYANRAKEEMLGVPWETLQNHGAVSAETVRAMAIGALNHSAAQVSIAVSGIAGPSGGSADKPVGTVWLAWGARGYEVTATVFYFPGDRQVVRRASVMAALRGVLTYLDQIPN